MKLTPNGLALLKEFEGFRSAPYLDSKGVPTIGFGATHYANGQRVTMNDPDISLAQANELLRRLIPKYESIIDRLVTVPLNQNQYDALVLFVYNVGEPQFSESTLLRLLNNGDYEGASKQFPRWKYSGGKVLKGLVTRRAKERTLFLMKPQQENEMEFIKTAAGTALRHGANFIGAWLISKGLLDADQAADLVNYIVGGGLVLVAAIWSLLRSKLADKIGL